ncbi:hypothetical protein C0992_002086 [Termitomyces sp. T32_za158]|nr:hypothetical protein C0992_002086 [Termitomyces sp. T32_za158]
MVLQPNFAKRSVSNMENTPPSILPKSLTSRFFPHRRRVHGNGQANSNKYAAEQAARRSRKQTPKQLKFNITTIPTTPDVVMSDATPLPSSSNTVPVALPKELGRPMYQEVTREALVACSSSFTQVPAAYLRDSFELIGPHALKSLASVRPQPFSPNKLPSEVEVKLECDDPLNPTHMLAIYGPPSASTLSTPMSKRQVTLYPVHAHFLAIHCSRLPPFIPFEDTVVKPKSLFKIPVRTLCLPSPSTYARLSTYIYTRNSNALLSSLMPCPPPVGIITPAAPALPLPSDEHRKLVMAYVYQIASKFTSQTILKHSTVVHGLWQNTCALGIFDDGLWEVIDVAWQILLAAIAVGTGASIDLVLGEEGST